MKISGVSILLLANSLMVDGGAPPRRGEGEGRGIAVGEPTPGRGRRDPIERCLRLRSRRARLACYRNLIGVRDVGEEVETDAEAEGFNQEELEEAGQFGQCVRICNAIIGGGIGRGGFPGSGIGGGFPGGGIGGGFGGRFPGGGIGKEGQPQQGGARQGPDDMDDDDSSVDITLRPVQLFARNYDEAAEAHQPDAADEIDNAEYADNADELQAVDEAEGADAIDGADEVEGANEVEQFGPGFGGPGFGCGFGPCGPCAFLPPFQQSLCWRRRFLWRRCRFLPPFQRRLCMRRWIPGWLPGWGIGFGGPLAVADGVPAPTDMVYGQAPMTTMAPAPEERATEGALPTPTTEMEAPEQETVESEEQERKPINEEIRVIVKRKTGRCRPRRREITRPEEVVETPTVPEVMPTAEMPVEEEIPTPVAPMETEVEEVVVPTVKAAPCAPIKPPCQPQAPPVEMPTMPEAPMEEETPIAEAPTEEAAEIPEVVAPQPPVKVGKGKVCPQFCTAKGCVKQPSPPIDFAGPVEPAPAPEAPEIKQQPAQPQGKSKGIYGKMKRYFALE